MSHSKPPSEGELLVLQALWECPVTTVQQVHTWLEEQGKKVAYTTVLTQLQRMHRKGLVDRQRNGKQHLYTAVPERVAVEAQLIAHLRDTAFGGSEIRLALRALGSHRQFDTGELDALQDWLAQQKTDTND
ncbi:hypothetical protein LEM8419_02110 [Neolewinella maritima]|uniref:BlaI/MecI/CopY family transcriptional regulator n=1 Tax=Neolewinella maritima TaxID=1383882 RepID=A0ABN8F9K7_9BACT|nr:BlaI/MecI/CopY family transcriptional regulator [Neolewinella maritima]CAH1001211.1 hypothetical protein LEM8419_02110 [Neolewinella maritima]